MFSLWCGFNSNFNSVRDSKMIYIPLRSRHFAPLTWHQSLECNLWVAHKTGALVGLYLAETSAEMPGGLVRQWQTGMKLQSSKAYGAWQMPGTPPAPYLSIICTVKMHTQKNHQPIIQCIKWMQLHEQVAGLANGTADLAERSVPRLIDRAISK
jgi:hypothetical protein